MPGYAPQGIFFPVEDEAPVGIDHIASAAETGGNIVQDLLAFHKVDLGGVQVRIDPAMPPVDIFNNAVKLRLFADGIGNGIAIGVDDGILEVLTFLHVLREHFHFHIGIVAIHNGGHLDAGAAVVFKVKVGGCHGNQIHIPVQTAIEGKVIDAVVHFNDDQIGVCNGFADIHTPGGVAAVVLGK